MPKSTYRDQYSLRLHTEDKVSFMELKKALQLSPRDCLVELMNYYSQGHTKVREDEQITLIMQVRVEDKSTVLKKMTFHGQVLYEDYYEGYYSLTGAILDAIEKDYGLTDASVPFMEEYIYLPKLNVYWHTEKKTYLVQIELDVIMESKYHNSSAVVYGGIHTHPLSVKRCCFVDDYSTLCDKFGDYIPRTALDAVAPIMAQDIGDNYELMDEWSI